MEIKFPRRSPTAGETRERMQRVRVGMTGLAAVGLVVMVATAVATNVRRSATQTAATVSAPAATAPVVDPKTEPLAQLGVAPDAKDEPSEKPAN